MKKTYESPKVEKVAFDYSDVVVASGTDKCIEILYQSVEISGGKCTQTYEYKTNDQK